MQRKRKKRRIRTIEAFIGMLFSGVILGLVIVNILTPNKEVSDRENRMLSQPPALTAEGIVSGDFMDAYEKYQSDQFAGRNFWRSVNVCCRRLGGSKEIEGVLLGKKGQLMENLVSVNQEMLEKNLSSIQNFTEQYPENQVYFMLVPDAAAVLTERLPNFKKTKDHNAMISQVENTLGDAVVWLDAAGVLQEHKDKKIYYETDHHWTSLGAFYVFRSVSTQMGINEDAASSFVSYPVSNDFNGMLASKSGSHLGVKETIEIYAEKEANNDVIVNYVEEQKRTTSLYDSSKLETRDQYAVFLGGNTAEVDIKTTSSSTRRLLVFKDSFANCFLPFLTPYFREIVVIDPRYYTGTIENLMQTYRITDTLFLYSGNTFFQDNHICGVLNTSEDE